MCTIIKTSPNDAILPKNVHIGEMKPLSNTDDSCHPPSVNEVTDDISSNHIDTQCTQPNSYPSIHPFHAKSAATSDLYQKPQY